MKSINKIFYVFLLFFNIPLVNLYAEENEQIQETPTQVNEFTTDFLVQSLIESFSYDLEVNELNTTVDENNVVTMFDADKELINVDIDDYSIHISFIDDKLKNNDELILEILINFVTNIYSLNETYLNIEGDVYYFEEVDGKTINVVKDNNSTYEIIVIEDTPSKVDNSYDLNSENNQKDVEVITSDNKTNSNAFLLFKGYYRPGVYFIGGVIVLLAVIVIFRKDRNKEITNIIKEKDNLGYIEALELKEELPIDTPIVEETTEINDNEEQVIQGQNENDTPDESDVVLNEEVTREDSLSINEINSNEDNVIDTPAVSIEIENISDVVDSNQSESNEKDNISEEDVQEMDLSNSEVTRLNIEPNYDIPSLIDVDAVEESTELTDDSNLKVLANDNIAEILEEDEKIISSIDLNAEIVIQDKTLENIELVETIERLDTNLKENKNEVSINDKKLDYEIPTLIDINEIEEEIIEDLNEESAEDLLNESIKDDIVLKSKIIESMHTITYLNHNIYGLGEMIMETEDCYYCNFNQPHGFKAIDKDDKDIKNKFIENK